MSKIKIDPNTDATIDVDVQTTFMPGGGLPVAGGDEIVPVVRTVNRLFPKHRRFATLDNHPRGHISLASSYAGKKPYDVLTPEDVADSLNTKHPLQVQPHAKFRYIDVMQYLRQVGSQVLWPDHGIIGTAEAELHPALSIGDYFFVLRKGTDPHCDSYSGFRDNRKRGTGLAETLRVSGAQRLFLKGLAYDFCVGWTALDAIEAGFDEVFVVKDATRSVNLPGTVDAIEKAFADNGVRVIDSEDLEQG